jgi:hypothetical protein
MAKYWSTRPSAIAVATGSNSSGNQQMALRARRTLSEFDKHRETLLSNDAEEGWASELRRYLSTMQWDVEKDTDIVEWWQVSDLSCESCHLIINCSTEPRPTLSDTRTHCTRHPSISGLIRSLRTGVLRYKTSCD